MWRPEYKILETWYLWLSSYGLPLLERLGGREANKVISETGIAVKTISHRQRCYWALHISLNITLWYNQEIMEIMATPWGCWICGIVIIIISSSLPSSCCVWARAVPTNLSLKGDHISLPWKPVPKGKFKDLKKKN